MFYTDLFAYFCLFVCLCFNLQVHWWLDCESLRAQIMFSHFYAILLRKVIIFLPLLAGCSRHGEQATAHEWDLSEGSSPPAWSAHHAQRVLALPV